VVQKQRELVELKEKTGIPEKPLLVMELIPRGAFIMVKE